MATNNAYVLIAEQEVTSTTASVTLTGLSSTYSTYYFVGTNVTGDTDGALIRVIPRVSGSTKTGTFSNEASYYSSLAGGALTDRDNGNYSTRDYIMQIPYTETTTTGANAYIEGWIMNSQSSSHNTYSVSNVVTSKNSDYGRRYLQQNEDDSQDVYDGLYIFPSTGNLESGKFQVYGLRIS